MLFLIGTDSSKNLPNTYIRPLYLVQNSKQKLSPQQLNIDLLYSAGPLVM